MTDWQERYATATRDVYRATLLDIAKSDTRVFCVDTDMGGLEDGFEAELPDQYVNVGIAEANLMGVSAGLAAEGLLPFANTIASFAATRACEQVKVDIAGNALPVRIVGTHGGFSAGHYGPTHHAVEDVAIMRSLPNLTVLVPADAAETEYAVRALADTEQLPGPVYLRLGRKATPLVHRGPYTFRIGQADLLRPGRDVTLVASGPVPVAESVAAAELLAGRGIAARVLNLHTVKPLDAEAVLSAARETAGLVTVEDHLVTGGLGGAVAELTAAHHPCRVHRIGVPDGFHDQVGTETELLARAGVTAPAIAGAAEEVMRERN
ncbi:transketolase [Streptomyces triticagri]|uniref:Transketolase n=1 Tax=Streptomyces triticagri TaxID=2293568 RepID=A0A372M2U0_9ACTN|nr:transketolase C-terminal domain-containing protein [Streptomyces triticagri]RFU85221.1 transketolase [Streptomyces triticagri]